MKDTTKGVCETRQQLAEEYGICSKTLKKLLKKNGIILKEGLLTPKIQEMIYNKLGFPKK